MKLRHLAVIVPFSPRIAIVFTACLWPAAASAQHRGTSGTNGHMIQHNTGGMHAGSNVPGGTQQGMPNAADVLNGSHHGHGHDPLNDRYPGAFPGGAGWGYGLGAYGFTPDMFNTMGMSQADQEAFKQARIMEIMNRSGMEYMQALQAYESARLAWQQWLNLNKKPAAPVSGLGSLVTSNRINWPVVVKSNKGRVIATQEAADKAVLAVHRQAVTKGYADEDLVSVAKEKLRLLSAATSKNNRLTKVGRETIAQFIDELDTALDVTLRRPLAEPLKEEPR